MSQQPDQQPSDMDEYYQRTRKPLFTIPTSRVGRFGCGLVLMIWFVVLLLPITMLWLAVGNTISIPHFNIPEPELHPRFEVQLVMEIGNRGLKLTTTHISEQADTAICLENRVNYWLWQSDLTATPATYCQCYQRDNSASPWVFTEQIEATCTP
ncbi:MAG: hypothetical protein ACFE0Q_17355 [Anaerolineae bacterium]